MKFPQIKSLTLAVTFCFAFYTLCGCSSTKQIASPLDKYDSMPYKDVITVPAKEDVAYKAAIVSLERRGYIVTLSDPQTGVATLELHTSSKLPEEEKQAQVEDKGPSVGTVILVALAVVLVVGIIFLIASSSDDDSKDKKKDEKEDGKVYHTGRIDQAHTGPTPSTGNAVISHKNERWHDNHRYIGPYISPFLEAAAAVPPPDPSYLYIVTVNSNPVTDSTTEIQLSTTRMDLVGGDIMSSQQLQNKYLNYSIFNDIGEKLQ